MSALLFWGCISPSEPSGVKVENMITLETVGYCRDLDLNDSLLVAAADQNGYVVYAIEFRSDGSFSYDEMYGIDPEDHEGEEFQGGEVQIASRYNYFLLMDQADALYYVNFTDVDSIGRIPYPGSENRDYVRGFSLDEADDENLLFLRSTGPKMEIPHSSPLVRFYTFTATKQRKWISTSPSLMPSAVLIRMPKTSTWMTVYW